MTLEKYISKLNTDKTKLVDEINIAMNKSSSWILKTIKNRLYQRGLDGNEKKIGNYAESTLAIKRANNQRSSFITLRDSGDFYNAMYTEWTGKDLIIDSSDIKTDLLINLYGPAILELTNFEVRVLIDTVIDPVITKFLNDNINIELFD